MKTTALLLALLASSLTFTNCRPVPPPDQKATHYGHTDSSEVMKRLDRQWRMQQMQRVRQQARASR